MAIQDLIIKQKQLMERVPHTIRPDSLVKMQAGLKIIDTLLRYLNSTGHKPWRPNPLPSIVQDNLLKELEANVGALSFIHSTTAGADKDFSSHDHYSRQLISTFGVIEESIEYANSLRDGSGRPHRLEEIVDILFFYMEQTLLGEFTWEEIEQEYHRKHAVNIKRYEDAEKGDFSWDKRGETNL